MYIIRQDQLTFSWEGFVSGRTNVCFIRPVSRGRHKSMLYFSIDKNIITI